MGWLLIALSVFVSAPAQAVEQWYLEFQFDGLDESAVRRAVALELREVDIPGDPRRSGETPGDVSLHVRVESQADALVVSLWDRGEFVGRRSLSLSAHPRILARRVGLAVGELGRQLAARRNRLVQVMQREAFLEEETKADQARWNRLRSFGMRTELRAFYILENGYLLGPGLGAEFNEHFPLRFFTGLSWMSGGLPVLADKTLGGTSPVWSLLDVWMGSEYVFSLSDVSSITAGVEVAGGAVHVGGAAEVDEIPQQRDTYLLRAAGRIGYTQALTDTLRFRTELLGGSLLRSIPVRVADTRVDFGGPFVGLNLGVTIAPHRQ